MTGPSWMCNGKASCTRMVTTSPSSSPIMKRASYSLCLIRIGLPTNSAPSSKTTSTRNTPPHPFIFTIHLIHNLTSGGTPMSKSVTPIQSFKCPSLSGKSQLGYQIGKSTDNKLHVRVTSNDGNGKLSKGWIAWDDIKKALKSYPKDKPITSYLLSQLYPSSSANCAGFLFACLVDLELFQAVPNKRQYQLLDIKAVELTLNQLKPKATTNSVVAKKRAMSKKAGKKKVSKKRPTRSKKKTTKK